MTDRRRAIPSTHAVLTDPEVSAAVARLGPGLVTAAIHHAQALARQGVIEVDQVARTTMDGLPRTATSFQSVINASGVIIHTNLGRSPLSTAARAAVLEAAGYTTVEFDLSTGKRALRGHGALSALAEQVPSAQGVHVVNNNAAALLLCGLALAVGREIVISRGEFVEIGDGFRLSELLTSTGARLREVGTTNRTTLADYRDALSPDTAFILKVHPSNFRITGFTATASTDELSTLGVPVVVDIGSGLLHPHPLLPDEPDANSALEQGATLVTASADKLLGGPQAGLLLGRADVVERLRTHPAARALRADKLTLAALEATLRGPTPPVQAALSVGFDTLRARATRLAERLRAGGVDAEVVPTEGMVGGGAGPGVPLPGVAVSLRPRFAQQLRRGPIPVVGRIANNRCLLDLRTVAPEEDEKLHAAVMAVHNSGED